MEPVIPSDHIKGTDQSPSPDDNNHRLKVWMRELWDLTKTVIVAFVIMLLLNVFVFNLSLVKGQSMEPTLENKERLFVNKIIYRLASPSSGDVVVLKDPSMGADHKPFLVKRIVGKPGDTIEIRNHELFVNGKFLNEPYTDVEIQDNDVEPITLGQDEYYVMGDNRHAGRSKDSRYFGSVKKEQIVGRAEFVFWPITKIRNL